jgi:nicotinamidase-related amidase
LAVQGGRDIIDSINTLLTSPHFTIKVGTKDFHPKDHVSFASNHPAPNNKPFESFVDVQNLVANKPQETMSQRLWPDHCIQGTPGSEFVDGLEVKRLDEIVHKGMDSRVEMYSAFADSFGNLTAGDGGVNLDLAKLLKGKGVTDTYVVGLAGDYCVKYTALDAAKSGFNVFLVEDAQKCVDAGAWSQTKQELGDVGVKVVTMKSPEIFNVLS